MLPVKKRCSISAKNRQAIRKYRQTHPLLSQQAIANWASQLCGHPISQSTICLSLSDKFAFLDDQKLSTQAQSLTRVCGADFPALEAALYEWMLRLNNSGVSVNGDMLKTTASELFRRMEDFKDQTEPKWSSGWLTRFKHRYSIKEYKLSGEIRSADIAGSLDKIRDLQRICAEYEHTDVYNADETGLFWLMTPDTTLASQPQSGGKIAKQRLTLHVCCNADGTHKLPLWIIGQANNPRAFGRNLSLIQGMDFKWRSNKKAWMTGLIMKEWLLWFDSQMAGRKVLLLLDGFSAHHTAVSMLENNPLLNTRVEFLPPNCTSVYQPCDQGIINMLKVRYRKRWLEALVRATTANLDAFKDTTVLRAVHWVIDAWRDVPADKIANCWRHSKLLSTPQESTSDIAPSPEGDDCRDLIADLRLPLSSTMTVAAFINPSDEVVEDDSATILDQVVQEHSQVETDDAEAEPDDDVEEAPPTHLEASHHISCLVSYYERRNPGDTVILAHLRKAQHQVFRCHVSEQASRVTQSSLDRYFTRK